MRRSTRALLGLAIVFLAATARAETSRPVVARLVWHAPPGAGCTSGADLEAAVEARLRREVFGPRPDVVVEGRVERLQNTWTVTLEMRTVRGEVVGTREIQSDAQVCSGLDESLALVIALIIDVTREDIRLQLPPPREPKPPAEPWRFETEAGGAAALGFLPGFSLGLRVGLGVDAPFFWPVSVEGIVWSDDRVENAQGGTRLEARQAALAVCPPLLHRRLALAACVGGGAVAIRATGYGFLDNDDQAAVVPFLSLGARSSYPLAGPLRLAAGLTGTAPLLRPRFVYDDLDGRERTLYRLPPFSGTATLGFSVAIP